jgi:hypothetical protein
LELGYDDAPAAECERPYFSKLTKESVVIAEFDVRHGVGNQKTRKTYKNSTIKKNKNRKNNRKYEMVEKRKVNEVDDFRVCDSEGNVVTKIIYVRLDMVSRYTPKTMATVGAMIGGNFRCGIDSKNNEDYYHEEYALHLPNEVPRFNEKTLEQISKMEVSQITQDHHMFLNTQELTVMYQKIKERVKTDIYDTDTRLATAQMLYDIRTKLDIDNKVSMVTHCAYIFVAPLFAVKHLAYIAMSSESPQDYMKLLKAESQAAKQLQTLFRDDLACIYELQVLRNRVFDSVNWRDEVDHRTNPVTVPIPMKRVYELSRQIFSEALAEGKKPMKISWDQYWSGRWSSMPGGSVVSQYDSDKRLKTMLPREAKIKSAWFAANVNGKYEYWKNRKPAIYASTSTKYEWGKVRALYGCDVTSFLHSDFAMGNCEDMLPSYFPVGKRANEKYIKRVIETFKLGVPLCFDYDDFNSQHSIPSMQAVLTAWRDVFSGALTAEQIESIEWTIDSVNDMSVKYNELDKLVNINGTLMSGWRLTSFMNTVLNRVYLVHAGLDNAVIYALHNGDDMFATTPNVRAALRLMEDAKSVGIRAQVSKTNIGTIGEFLRVDTRAQNSTSSQYLARAVATMVHGRVETAAPNDLMALTNAIETRADEVVARGGDSRIIAAVKEKMFSFVASLFEVTVDVMAAFRDYHPVQGGANKEGKVRASRLERKAMNSVNEHTMQKFAPIQYGVNQYIQMLVDKFNLDYDIVNRKNIREKAVQSLLREKVSYELVIETQPNISVYRGVYKAWTTSRWIAPITKMRSLGFVPARELPGMTSSLAELIRQSRDPLAFMNAIF